MRKAVALVLIFLLSVLSPLAAASTTETQFKDGSTSYTHTFTGLGNGTAGVVSIPYGAEVTAASFNLRGEASSTAYTNFTTSDHLGGVGDANLNGNYGGPPSPYQYITRNGVDVQGSAMELKGNPTLLAPIFDNTNQVSDLDGAHQNTTGEFVSLGDQGYVSPTKDYATLSLTGGSWSYTGVVVPVSEDQLHVIRMSSSSSSATPYLQRYNASTGAYLGTGSFLSGSCSGTSLGNYIVDADVYDGHIYSAHYTYSGRVTKWALSGTNNQNWQCQSNHQYPSNNYITGVDIDDNTGKMYVGHYSSSTTSHSLREVNPASPTVVNGTWFMTSTTNYWEYGMGLSVNLPSIIYNVYAANSNGNWKSTHHHFNMQNSLLSNQGSILMPGGGHYGLVGGGEDNTVMYACHYSSTAYCTQGVRKAFTYGDGSLFDPRTPTSTSATVVGPTTSLSRAITTVDLSAVLGAVPTGTSIDVDISLDGGSTWKAGSPGQRLNFATPGSSLVWRATLNGTSTEAPVLGDIILSYVTSYLSNGYYNAYSYSTGSSIVAITADWDEDVPVGTSVRVMVGYSSSTSCTSGSTGVQSFLSPNTTQNVNSGNSRPCIRVELSTSNSGLTPTVSNLSIAFHSNAPSEPGINIDKRSAFRWPANNGALVGPLAVRSTQPGNTLVDKLNDAIPDTGSGIKDVQIDLVAASSGILVLDSFEITYTMQTVNLDMTIPEGEVLHERVEPYEVVTRHVIGETATSIASADLTLMTNSLANNPILTWQSGDIFPAPNDPGQYIQMDPSSYSTQNNGILEIHWKFFVTSDFPDQDNVRFKVSCQDDSGASGFSPLPLTSQEGLNVNRSFGLGWLNVRDNDGEMTSQDVADRSWVAAGERLHFVGAMWFMGTEDAPKDSAFDVRISRNGYVESTARDVTNNNGTFFISIDLPNIDVPDGMTYEVQTYNERSPEHVQQPNAEWRRTYKVDATAPERMAVHPQNEDYEAASIEQPIKVLVQDAVGHPMELVLNYWVEADHDLNRNGEADLEEYAIKTVRNNTEAQAKWFMTSIDTSRNPNMGRVSYFWDGGDQAGNPLHYTAMNSEDEVLKFESEDGFLYDDATFRTRKDSSAVFTGLEWFGHEDNQPVYAGLEQTISLGFIDANTAIDFEYISLVFDFEGPNPLRDAQSISYSGLNNTFWSDSSYIHILPSSLMTETTNESGLPWILLDFHFTFSWDWPDEEMGDVALLYKELGSDEAARILLLEHTFRVENDLMLSPTDFSVDDISQPRTGPVADGSRVRKDDRLAFAGRVVYEGSQVPAPRNVGILVEVFDGEKLWSDGSLTNEGEYAVEVPLSSALTLQSSPSRTCLISITNIPGRGEDMTGTLVSTTLQVVVDDAAPRVTRRIGPLNVIDISATSDLTQVPVEFQGTEDADLTGSQQIVHWVMRDATRTMTIGSGSTLLGMQQDDQDVRWTAVVDITAGGTIVPRVGDFVGFYITGYDAAGNQFPVVSNSEASPVPELAVDDLDFERQWVRLGAVGPELRVDNIALSDDHIAPGAKVKVTANILNTGGNTTSQFKVAFFAGDAEKPFFVAAIVGMDAGERLSVPAEWTSTEVDRVRVVVDFENEIPEANDNDNAAEHAVTIAYGEYFGWFDSVREQPLAWMFILLTIMTLAIVFTVATRTSIDFGEGAFEDDEDWDDDEEGDDDYDDDEFDDDDD